MIGKIKRFFNKEYWICFSIVFVTCLGCVGYRYGVWWSECRDYYVIHYTDEMRMQVRNGNHAYTDTLLNYNIYLFNEVDKKIAFLQIDVILKEDPECSEAWALYGYMLGVRQKWEKMVEAFNKSIELNPEDKSWVTGAGDTLNNAKSRECIEIFEKHYKK